MKQSGCELCGGELAIVLERHHVIPVAEEGGDESWNIVYLCANCHGLVHRWKSLEKRRKELGRRLTMPIGFKCDRCGEFKTGEYYELLAIYYSRAGDKGDYEKGMRGKALCPECYRELDEWVKTEMRGK